MHNKVIVVVLCVCVCVFVHQMASLAHCQQQGRDGMDLIISRLLIRMDFAKDAMFERYDVFGNSFTSTIHLAIFSSSIK